jgi:hypothetical protein
MRWATHNIAVLHCRKFPNLAAPNEAEKRKGGPPGRLRAPVGEIASVDFFDHPALARVDQISPVFAMDIPVFTK